MLERGQRRLTPELALRTAKLYNLAPTTLPRSRLRPMTCLMLILTALPSIDAAS
jgi:hypothetical protein